MLGFELAAAVTKKRISADQKDQRDLLIYLLWESGGLTNQEIGSYFVLTYSSVSRRNKNENGAMEFNFSHSNKKGPKSEK